MIALSLDAFYASREGPPSDLLTIIPLTIKDYLSPHYLMSVSGFNQINRISVQTCISTYED